MGLLDMELSVISRIVVTALSISFARNKSAAPCIPNHTALCRIGL